MRENHNLSVAKFQVKGLYAKRRGCFDHDRNIVNFEYLVLLNESISKIQEWIKELKNTLKKPTVEEETEEDYQGEPLPF